MDAVLSMVSLSMAYGWYYMRPSEHRGEKVEFPLFSNQFADKSIRSINQGALLLVGASH